jgi:hypothetical protein
VLEVIGDSVATRSRFSEQILDSCRSLFETEQLFVFHDERRGRGRAAGAGGRPARAGAGAGRPASACRRASPAARSAQAFWRLRPRPPSASTSTGEALLGVGRQTVFDTILGQLRALFDVEARQSAGRRRRPVAPGGDPRARRRMPSRLIGARVAAQDRTDALAYPIPLGRSATAMAIAVPGC